MAFLNIWNGTISYTYTRKRLPLLFKLIVMFAFLVSYNCLGVAEELKVFDNNGLLRLMTQVNRGAESVEVICRNPKVEEVVLRRIDGLARDLVQNTNKGRAQFGNVPAGIWRIVTPSGSDVQEVISQRMHKESLKQ